MLLAGRSRLIKRHQLSGHLRERHARATVFLLWLTPRPHRTRLGAQTLQQFDVALDPAGAVRRELEALDFNFLISARTVLHASLPDTWTDNL